MEKRFDWLSLLVGILMLLAGGYTLFAPLGVLLSLPLVLGVLAIAKGVQTLWLRHQVNEILVQKSSWLLWLGIIDIVIGLLFIIRMGLALDVIVFIFAVWFIFDAIFEIMTARVFKADKGYYWLLIILSVLGLILGIILLFNPLLASATLVWLIAFYLIFIGIGKIIQAF